MRRNIAHRAVATKKHACALLNFSERSPPVATVDTEQEYPDIVGARPTNPLAANFKSFIPPLVRLPELMLPHRLIDTLLGIVTGQTSLHFVLQLAFTVS